ncbi:MAG: hypothetical protein ACOYXC_18690 [Candidatus Rifleibacteriota bacterium]
MRIVLIVFAVLIAILAALILLALVFAVIAIIAEKIRQMLLKPCHDDRIGDYLFRNGFAEANLRILGNDSVFSSFPVSEDGKLADSTADLLVRLREFDDGLKAMIGKEAVEDFKQIFDPEDVSDDEYSKAMREMQTLVDDPEKFISQFEVLRLNFADDSEEITIDFLTPWDPEHSVSAVLNFELQLKKYALTCSM